MAKLIKEESVPLPVSNRYKHGLSLRYLEIGKFELWLLWLRISTLNILIGGPHKEPPSWKKVKELAANGKLCQQVWAPTVWSGPIYTNIYTWKQ